MRHQAIERLLPAAYQRAAAPGSVLNVLLDVMEAMHAPDEAVLDTVDDLFSAYRTLEPFVPFLARWLALDHLLPHAFEKVPARAADGRLPIPVGRLRDLVAEGAALAQWRGTPEGMRRTLEVATGVAGFAIDEPPDRPYHFVVRVPPAATDQLALIRRIVEVEKPAATTAEVPDPVSASEENHR
jgi:phage tail-like protein